jgi:hypothetical protein
MAFFKVKDGRVSGHVMSSNDDFLPSGEKGNAIDMALDAGAGFVPAKYALVHPSGYTPENRGKPTTYSVWNESVDPPALLNPSVSHTYSATPYMQTIQTIEEVFPNSTVGFSNIHNGARIMLFLELTGSIDLGDGDIVTPNLVVIDSLDGSHSTKIIPTVKRGWCDNQLPFSRIVFSAKHTVNHNVLLSKWTATVARARNDWEEFVDRASSFKRINFDRRHYAYVWLLEVMPRPEKGERQSEQGYQSQVTRWENTVDRIMARYDYESAEFGHNAWSLIQAIQHYEYHVKTKGDPDKQANVIIDPAKKQALTNRMERLALQSI